MGHSSDITPGFLLMDVQAATVTTYVYTLTPAGEVKVDKHQHTK